MTKRLVRSTLLLTACTAMVACSPEQDCINRDGIWFGDSDNGYCCEKGEKCKDPQPTRRYKE